MAQSYLPTDFETVYVKHLSETFTDQEHQELSAIKGERSWREAILEEFGVEKEGSV